MPTRAAQLVPDLLTRADHAPAPRTLVDILAATAAAHPEANALDDGEVQLTYAELHARVYEGARWLAAHGIGRGDRVGVRMPSGDRQLYLAILSVLASGAAYVPIDADDPDERAELVFGEARVSAVITAAGLSVTEEGPALEATAPTVDDTAWIIFTSGSTGTPKGVAVSHRNAAAFVDAEARLFLQDTPIGPGDRVLAGLSVAFDASCEEMWLAWRHGACLVPAPRSLVRSGTDLGPWLIARDVTVVSTVPTLAALWPPESLESVRLLIFGGEACPPELAERLAIPGREVWNTYGPTEATVVACAARLTGAGPVRIGLPLDGWDLAVVDSADNPVAEGEVGELIIGGVGLARYLDPAKDAEKYAPLASLGWDRAYRSGDLVRLDTAGLIFQGRADDQVKIGGRRIELGEVDAALQALPGVSAAAAAVRHTATGTALLIGYLVAPADFDRARARELLTEQLPAALVPRLAVLDRLPTRTSGKVDRAALPWPLPGADPDAVRAPLDGTAGWLAGLWTQVLGAQVTGPDDDFFTLGGGSLAAAQLVSMVRERHPEITVAQLYDHPRLGSLAGFLDDLTPAAAVETRRVQPIPRRAQFAQIAATVPLTTLTGLQWVTWLAIANNVLAWAADVRWAPTLSWWWVLAMFVVFITPLGRMALSAGGARLLLRGVAPGTHPRGGSVHLRIWIAERLAEASGAANLAGATWMVYYARVLGADIGRHVDLHTLPPVTGMLELGDGAAVEPETDLSGYWVDGDVIHVGRIAVGADATVGARSTLLPGATIGAGAEIAPGSAVFGKVKAGQRWAGSPAVKVGKAKHPWPDHRPPRASRWVPVYGLTSVVLSGLPLASIGCALALLGWRIRDADTLGKAALRALPMLPVATAVALLVFAVVTVAAVRLLGLGLRPGYHPVRSRVGWQVWATERLMDSARTFLFPLYASLLTPLWLRLLGARIGRGVEASTVLMLPRLTTVADGAFLADDTMIGSYELGGGWLRIERAKVGKRAFLGNSGMTGPGRTVPKNGLVAVLSATPDKKGKSGSSWLGSPPVRLRRSAAVTDAARTFAPPTRLKVARGVIETCRLIPVIVTFGIGLGVLFGLQALAGRFGFLAAALLSGLVLLVAGAVAGAVSAAAKWLTVGRIQVCEHPLWSSFVWRNEVSDAFVETVAAPWFARAATGTVVLNVWLRAMGARIGRGVWCETYWLPEADLVALGDGATVSRGCVVQTHLFHDRIMSMDTVTLGPGATLGPHCVALPASAIGAGATVGPASLVMRGDSVPDSSRWQGNPIVPEARSGTTGGPR
ncbi:amino acid adenylation domain-containing protein [Rhodococcus sp. D2-41]|uniref:Amino acid adenylation domain-containing protein n=1 Tax=Speluncibacter jeojiensis TaxID=2710754 RepID=A0A9X4RG15_9ACTN|nr:Pls/PosA family non-ribosomal peptide synthetase [Rhodococcus sp. D2-41]MDG3009331.1 amino acid adenylation domain-containing protein [Rhodococcus sp. D2-41]MDG3016882.1 amino acid adenylation domain-containing protein [Corynebacteriales bacterium D3-21]